MITSLNPASHTLSNHTVQSARAGLQSGAFSAVELTTAYLERIHGLNPRLNAFITVADEAALAQARAADQRIARGDTSPLLGIPLGLKDVLSTSGLRTTAGSRILENYIPVWDATVVARLRAAGAVFVGKCNTDEFAMGSTTENSGYGVTRNPHDESRVPGGSSGGPAAAVAADLCVAAIGTDTGGSVRTPAAFCGITGLKNSYGRVSRYGVLAYGSSLDSVGVLARNAMDAALVNGIIAGHDPSDATCVDIPVPNYAGEIETSTNLRGLKVGVPREYFVDGLQREVRDGIQTGIKQLEALGARIVEVSLPNTSLALSVYYMIAPAEVSSNLSRFDGVRYGLRVSGHDLVDMVCNTRTQGFGPEAKRRIMLGTYALSAGYYDAYYTRAQKVRTLIKRDFERAFEQVDVMVSPITPTTAFKIGEKADDPITMYLTDVFTVSMNLAGTCGLSVPCGKDDAGLPIGMQVMGPWMGESTVLKVAQAFQQAVGYGSYIV